MKITSTPAIYAYQSTVDSKNIKTRAVYAYQSTAHSKNIKSSMNNNVVSFKGMEDDPNFLPSVFGAIVLVVASYLGFVKWPEEDEIAYRAEWAKEVRQSLRNAYTNPESERGGKRSYNEQAQEDEIVDMLEHVTEDFSFWYDARERKYLYDVANNLISEFTSPTSDHGVSITYEEQEMLRDGMEKAVKDLKGRKK